jgi:hypothetical protein
VALDRHSEIVPFDVSPDGGSIATHQEETQGDVWVIETERRPLDRGGE